MAANKQETKPGIEGIDGDDKENPDDVALLIGNGVIFQVQEDLREKKKKGRHLT